MTVSGVLFDIGGVLELVEPWDRLHETWERHLGVDPGRVRRVAGEVDPDGLLMVGRMTEPQMRRRWADLLDLTDEQADVLMRDQWDWYCGRPDTALIEYARGLRPRVTTAILSNSADGARREEQARYGFEQLVDVILYSHEVGLAKPDPRIFALACDRLELPPDRLVLVDDVPVNVEAARAAGLHAVLHRDAASSIAAVERLLG